MLNLELAMVMNEDRQREIERLLRHRSLLRRVAEAVAEVAEARADAAAARTDRARSAVRARHAG
jgi:hypothetical protein